MPVAIFISVLLVAGLLLLWSTLGRSAGGDDIPARIVAVAAGRLPARLREWGQAMTAELIQIPERVGRWRFAADVLRVVLFPSARSGRRALVTALAGLATAAGVTAAAASEVGRGVPPRRDHRLDGRARVLDRARGAAGRLPGGRPEPPARPPRHGRAALGSWRHAG
jgi:hypothetical protein